MGDPMRYYELFEMMYNGEETLFFLETNYDPAFYIIFLLFSKISPYLSLLVISLAVAYIVLFFLIYLRVNKLVYILFASIIILIGDFGPVNYLTGAWRQIFALSLFLLSINIRIKSLKLVTVVLSGLSHSTLILPALFYLFYLRYLSQRISLYKIFLDSFIFIVIIFLLLYHFNLYESVNDFIYNRINQYQEIDARDENHFSIFKYLYIVVLGGVSFMNLKKIIVGTRMLEIDLIITFIAVFSILAIIVSLLLFSESLAIRILNSFYLISMPLIFVYIRKIKL